MDKLSKVFVSAASDILAETNLGLGGSEIVKKTVTYAHDWNVEIPHTTYPFDASSKRVALCENLMAFSERQRFQIIKDLCEHPTVVQKNREEVKKLKLKLIARYGHLVGDVLSGEIDGKLLQRTEHWLAFYPDALTPYQEAVKKHANGIFPRNVLDDLRLALELLLKCLLSSPKSLENQITTLGPFIKERGGSPELANMFVKLIDYYTKYQNSYVKHNDAVIEEEVELIFELTSCFMKHLVRLSCREST